MPFVLAKTQHLKKKVFNMNLHNLELHAIINIIHNINHSNVQILKLFITKPLFKKFMRINTF